MVCLFGAGRRMMCCRLGSRFDDGIHGMAVAIDLLEGRPGRGYAGNRSGILWWFALKLGGLGFRPVRVWLLFL